jgi:hypothetical protein
MDYLEMTKQVVRPKRMNAKGEERSLLWSDINGKALQKVGI